MTIRHLEITHVGVATRDWRYDVPEDIREYRLRIMARSLSEHLLTDPELFTLTEKETDDHLSRFTMSLHVVTTADAKGIKDEAYRQGAVSALTSALDQAGRMAPKYGYYATECYTKTLRELLKEYEE